MTLPLTTLTTLNRQQLGEVFKDPRTLLAFERIQLQVATIIPATFAAFQNLDFVVTAADPSIPNAHVITEGANIDVATAAGLVTITATPSGADHQIQFNNAGAFGAFTLGGDATINTATGVLTIASHAVTNAKFRQSAALSVVGNSSNATADVADIAAGSDGQVLRRSGTALGFGAVNLASANAVTGVLAFANGGTGQSSYTDGQLLIGNTSTGGLNKATLTAGTNVTITNAGGAITINATGGTGTVSSVASADGSITVTNPTTTVDLAVAKAPKLTTARTIAMSGDVVWSTSFDGSGNVTAGGTIQANAVTTTTINNSAVTLAKIANAAANTRFLGSGSAGSGAAYAEQTISAGSGISIAAAGSGITITAVGGGISGAAPYTYVNAPFANVTSLLHFDGTNGSTTITDQVLSAWTAVGSAAISTAQSVYGGASLLVPGASNSSVKHTTSSGFDVGTGDWAIEFQWRYNSTPQTSARVFATRDGDTNQGIALTIDASSVISISLSSTGSSYDILNGFTPATLSQSAWNPIIVQRRGIYIEIFVSGTLVALYTIGSKSIYYNSGDTVVIGGNATSTSRSMNAYIDEFRFTKGAYVMVPGNPGLPSAAFPNS